MGILLIVLSVFSIFKLYIEFKKNDKSKMKLYGALFIGSIFVLFLIYYLAPKSM